MKKNFLLNSKLAESLYDAVSQLPIIDWHNHLCLEDLTINRRFENLTELWLKSDPYKHRAMRICGIPEQFITGSSSDWEKFQAWSQVLPQLIGNPLYHWSQLELSRIFDISEDLTPQSAERIWKIANAQLHQDGFSARELLRKFNVTYVAPCVNFNEIPLKLDFMPELAPSFRGDDLTDLTKLNIPAIEHHFKLTISSLDDFKQAIHAGVASLHHSGCRFSDHALDSGFVYYSEDGQNYSRFRKFLNHELPENEKPILESALLRVVGREYAQYHWTMQLHIGALRHTSTRLRHISGPAGGYAGIAAPCSIAGIANFLNDLEQSPAGLPPVILYTLNPADMANLAVLSGSFCEAEIPGKVQLGPAWWFCDHIYGMKTCFENIATFGVLSTFLGMTTDSRSLLSFVRHEYFRRVFCNWVSQKVDQGEFPADFNQLKTLVEAVCYGNAARRLNINNPK